MAGNGLSFPSILEAPPSKPASKRSTDSSAFMQAEDLDVSDVEYEGEDAAGRMDPSHHSGSDLK